MLGKHSPENLPPDVLDAVQYLFNHLSKRLGPIRMEWVYDGDRAWVVQLHRGSTGVDQSVIVPGETHRFHRFDVTNGIEALRIEAAAAKTRGEGIVLVGDVGLTSHFGDVLRRLAVPSRIERTPGPE
jgi:hypothetical protein